MNKNIHHNGKHYPKDSEIKESDAGFKELRHAGHVEAFGDGLKPGGEEKAKPEGGEEKGDDKDEKRRGKNR